MPPQLADRSAGSLAVDPAMVEAARADAAAAGGPSPVSLLRRLMRDGGRPALTHVLLPTLGAAALLWAVTVRLSSASMMRFPAFALAWAVMMAAMMLPAVAPVVALYALAARRRAVAPVPAFLAGYLAIWLASAVPAYLVARQLSAPLDRGAAWVGRLAGATLLVAAGYELSPLKSRCLRACRSPLTFFLARRGSLRRPAAALAAGAQHGLYCFGCCWALMAVLMAVGGMQLAWAALLAAVVSAQKVLPWGARLPAAVATAAGAVGCTLLVVPSLLHSLVVTSM